MRRNLVVGLAVLAFLGVVAPPVFAQAPAPKVTVEGFLDQTTVWSNNMSVLDIDVTSDKDKEWYGRTRGRFQITGEVGKAKGVFLFEQDNNYGTQAGGCYGSPLGAGHFGTRDGCLNTELTGNVEMLWLFTEFPVTGPGSLLPFVPAAGTARLGFQPFENDTYKLAILTFGNFGGLHLDIDPVPGVKVTATYAQIEEAGTGRLFGNVRGDDFAAIFSAELSPMKGLDVKPIYAYTYIDGTANPANPFSYGPRTGKGGVSDSSGFFPQGAEENRHTIGLDAKWKMGPFSVEPTFLYQWGSRNMVPSVASSEPVENCNGAACVEQDISAWIFDVRGGWQSGPLTVEGMFVYASGNSAEEDLRAGRTINYYQPIDVNAVFGYGWGAITAISDEYISQLYYGSTGLCAACSISYDKYGSVRLGARASYAVTPSFKLRGVLMGLWTAEDVDTLSNVGAGGLTAVNTGSASQGKESHLGTELNVGFDWNFAPNITLLWTYGHLFAGEALDNAGSVGGANSPGAGTAVRSAKDVDLLSAVVRYTF